MAEELDMKGLFYKLADPAKEGQEQTMDRKNITRALKVGVKIFFSVRYIENIYKNPWIFYPHTTMK